MLKVEVPGFSNLDLEYLVLDFNGTIAIDGTLIPGVKERINELAQHLKIFVITADTFGTVKEECKDLNVEFFVLKKHLGTKEKESFVINLGVEKVTAIGNGSNDKLMLQQARLGIAALQNEGTSLQTLMSADVVTTSINDALDLLLKPKRLVATLRQ